MARRLLESYFETSNVAMDVREGFLKALSLRDPAGVVSQINALLARTPYDYFQTNPRDEYFYCFGMFTLFYAAELDPRPEDHGSFGRSDFILKHGGQNWAVEIKVSHDDGGDDSALATAALGQIKARKYGDGLKNPVLLGLVVNDQARRISAWECEGGIAARPEPGPAAERPSEAEEPEPPRPRMRP